MKVRATNACGDLNRQMSINGATASTVPFPMTSSSSLAPDSMIIVCAEGAGYDELLASARTLGDIEV